MQARDYDSGAQTPYYLPTQGLAFPPPYTPSPAHQTPASSSGSGANLTRDAEFLIQSFLPAAPTILPFEAPRIPLPYCVPQLTAGFDTPFARGYNRAFESLDLPQERFLDFIDGLNLAMTASPPMRVVDLAGHGIAYVYVAKSCSFDLASDHLHCKVHITLRDQPKPKSR